MKEISAVSFRKDSPSPVEPGRISFDAGARFLVARVSVAGLLARAALDQDLEVRLDELFDTLGNEGDSFLSRYYFLRYADYQSSCSRSDSKFNFICGKLFMVQYYQLEPRADSFHN